MPNILFILLKPIQIISYKPIVHKQKNINKEACIKNTLFFFFKKKEKIEETYINNPKIIESAEIDYIDINNNNNKHSIKQYPYNLIILLEDLLKLIIMLAKPPRRPGFASL
jgi:hypothetical protein